MSKITLDPKLQESILSQVSERVEFTNTTGEVVGYFLTPAQYWRLSYDAAKALVTEEELEEARRDPQTYTTAEVLTYLKSLSNPGDLGK